MVSKNDAVIKHGDVIFILHRLKLGLLLRLGWSHQGDEDISYGSLFIYVGNLSYKGFRVIRQFFWNAYCKENCQGLSSNCEEIL